MFNFLHLTMNPLSVSVDLPVLDVSYKRDHTLCVLLCLASLTEHRVLKVHPRGSLGQSFTPFHGCIIFHCVDGPHAVCPSIT